MDYRRTISYRGYCRKQSWPIRSVVSTYSWADGTKTWGTSDIIAGIQPEIRTEHLRNMSQERYSYNNQFRVSTLVSTQFDFLQSSTCGGNEFKFVLRFLAHIRVKIGFAPQGRNIHVNSWKRQMEAFGGGERERTIKRNTKKIIWMEIL
jgi:hypothetical protein